MRYSGPWFLIVDEKFRNAYYNMAVDEALFNKCEREENKTFIRFYGWNPPSVSIGRSQKAKSVINHNKTKDKGIDFVRRPTGGKTVLHYDELTYSVNSSDSFFVDSSSVRYIYNLIAKALLRGLKNLKLDAKIVSKDPKGLPRTNLPCFSYPTRDEIVIKNKKIIGSAQKRTKNAFLQHGSVPVKDIREIYADLTNLDKNILLKTMTTIEVESGEKSFKKITESFIKGFEEEFEIELEKYSFNSLEEKEINDLINNKYSKSSWNFEL